jgi:hypothetical protein
VATTVVPPDGLQLTSAQKALANQTVAFLTQKGLWSQFTGVNGELALEEPLATLQANYNLTAAEVQIIQSILTYNTQRIAAATTTPSTGSAGVVSPYMFVRGTVLYLTDSDVGFWLLAAAYSGPWALMAALDALATVVGGPVGTVISGMRDVIGFTTLGGLAYLIVQSAVTGRGVYFGITWNWIFPNYTQGTWCGCS